MTNENISSRVREVVDTLPRDGKSVVVLKGVPLSLFDESADLDAAAKNPLNYFLQRTGARKFLSHEEFILLGGVVLMQFDAVYVVDNNSCGDEYPIEQNFSDATKTRLLDHFARLEDADNPVKKISGDAGKIVDIFTDLREENFLFGVYNDAELLSKPKVTVLNLFAVTKKVSRAPKKIVRREKYPLVHREKFADILKRLWSFDAFRTFKVYDLDALDAGEKIIRDVSQERIISDIVAQVERCLDGKKFRDVFVTAPTGAGKSLIFQIPAIYLAERFNLLTIVVSPLIALMNDHVINLGLKNFDGVETINSETPPNKRAAIVEKISSGKCNLLYVSPETLVHRNDIDQLIGGRTIGLVVIDEAHIVTTWGKQFRPDYWYLGDYINRLRKVQRDAKGHGFVIAAFTATAIYHGADDMYDETLSALNMFDPITYLGRIKRDDIEIKIDTQALPTGTRLEDAKNAELLNVVRRAKLFGEKTLIYFPFVRLVEDAKYFFDANGENVEIYHGRLRKEVKRDAYDNFRSGKSLVMLATKAFGMGIDISDIKNVWHFAAPGSVCDYVQEIGRAARAENFSGAACYHYDKRDFKYVNTLHRLSAIKKYQLVEVLKKIRDIYYHSGGKNFLLLDAENFSYIFDSDDENDSVAKVKLALLTVQKDFELRTGFAPLRVRPCPMFAKGYFKISASTKKVLVNKFGNCVESTAAADIFSVNLKAIWETNFGNVTFPQFKHMIYSADDALPDELKKLRPTLRVTVDYKKNYREVFGKFFGKFKAVVAQSIGEQKIISVDDLRTQLFGAKISEFKARSICEVLLSTADAYGKNFYTGGATLFMKHFAGNGFGYRFNPAIKTFFAWVERIFDEVINGTVDDKFFITDEIGKPKRAEFVAVLGVLEAAGVLTFNMSGGAGNQLAIRVLQVSKLKRIVDKPQTYRNRILELTEARHKLSIAMLKHIYESNFTNAQLWDVLEDYFLGKIPDEVLSVTKT